MLWSNGLKIPIIFSIIQKAVKHAEQRQWKASTRTTKTGKVVPVAAYFKEKNELKLPFMLEAEKSPEVLRREMEVKKAFVTVNGRALNPIAKARVKMNPIKGEAYLHQEMRPVMRRGKLHMRNQWVGKKELTSAGEKHDGHWINIRGHRVFLSQRDNKTISAVEDSEKSKHLLNMKLSTSDHGRFLANTGQIKRSAPRSGQEKIKADKEKFKRVQDLAKKSMAMMVRIKEDLKLQDNDKRKVEAAIMSIMLKANIRVGNQESAQYGVFGATTLTSDHITISGDNVRLKFKGKSGVEWDKTIVSSLLASALNGFVGKVDRGSPVMQYRDAGDLRPMKDVDVRSMFKKTYGLLPKDIRTWNASNLAFKELRKVSIGKGDADYGKDVAKRIKTAIERVATEMGHTPAMAKNNYISPIIIQDFIDNGGYLSIDKPKYGVAEGD